MKKTLILAAILVTVAASGAAMAADTATVAVTANVLGTCKVTNAAGALAFGALDPTSAVTVNGVATQPVFWCTKGATYTIADDKGLNEGAGTVFQMKHASLADLIPYTFTYTTTGTGAGPQAPITMNIAGTVAAADYSIVSAGNYADTVTLTITP